MKKAGLMHLYDEKGQPATIADLPEKLTDMKDDPYRSLAWFVREAKGYDKIETLYVEFAWANYFRKSASASTLSTTTSRKPSEEALILAKDPAAENLPGYKKPACRQATLPPR